MTWIACADRLPEIIKETDTRGDQYGESVYVLAYVELHPKWDEGAWQPVVCRLSWDGKTTRWVADQYDYASFEMERVTHWMPLPESPK